MSLPKPDSTRKGPRPGVAAQELAGAAMALAGSAILSGLVYISNASSPFAEHLLFRLGLALTSLISAGAQVLVVAGIAVMWTAARRNRQGS